MSGVVSTILCMDQAFLKSRPAGELEDAIGQLHGACAAVHHSLLELICAYEDKGAWKDDGAGSMADWLACYLGVSFSTAREWVRVARALESLPALSQAYLEGRLSFDQVKALSRVATKETEQELIEQALGMNAAQIEMLARSMRRIPLSTAEEAYHGRSLRLFFNEETRWWRVSGRLCDSDGAVVEKALEHLADKAGPDPVSGLFDPGDSRMADALVELSSTYLGVEGDADRATVVVHVDLKTLRDGEGVAEIDDGPAIAKETARRLSCDSNIEVVVDGPKGHPVGIGRKSRKVPAWLLRQLRRRDRGCVFPSCHRTRWLNAHHIRHWAEGGATNRENLVLLCGYHHRLLHEGGWRIRGRPGHNLRFVHPNGRVLTTGPPPLRPEVRARLPAA